MSSDTKDKSDDIVYLQNAAKLRQFCSYFFIILLMGIGNLLSYFAGTSEMTRNELATKFKDAIPAMPDMPSMEMPSMASFVGGAGSSLDHLPSPVYLPTNEKLMMMDELEKLESINASLASVNVTTWQQRTKNLRYSCKRFYQPFKDQECARNISVEEQDNNGLGMACDPEHPMMPDRYNFILDIQRSLMMCLPPKSACTTWQRFYLAIKFDDLRYLDQFYDPGNWDSYIYKHSERLEEFLEEEQQDLQMKIIYNQPFPYWKIMSSRHPFERMYSGWKDKFSVYNMGLPDGAYGPEYWVEQRAVAMKYDTKHEFFDQDLDQVSLNFLTFVKYLIGEDLENIDPHFKPQSYHCSPCEAMFDYVATTETMSVDMIDSFDAGLTHASDIKTLEEIKEKRVAIPSLKSYKQQYANSEEYVFKASSAQTYFQEIAKYDPQVVLDIYRKYQWDFILLGYNIAGYF